MQPNGRWQLTFKRSLTGMLLLVVATAIFAAACGGADPEPIPTPTATVTATPEPTPTTVPPTAVPATPTLVPPTAVPATPTPEDLETGDQATEPKQASEEMAMPLVDDFSSLVGAWEGKILAMGLQINFTVEFVMEGDELAGSMSVPGQGIMDARLGKVSWEQGSISFTDPVSGVTFDGDYDGTQIKGTFENQGLTFGFSMNRAE